MIYSVFKIYRYIAIVAATGLLALVSCKRDEPVNVIEKPVFGIKGTVNGVPINIKAGVDSYYLYTSYSYDSSLYKFKGDLRKTDCSVCPNSISITIYDSVYNNGSAPVSLNLVLQKKDLEFAGNIGVKEYKLTFNAEDTGFGAPKYTWKMDTLIIGTTKNIIGTFPDTATRNICLIVEDSLGSCIDQRCNPVKPLLSVLDTCQPNFTISKVDDSTVQYISAPRNSYSWDFGDSKTSSLQSGNHKYDSLKAYNVCLTTSFGGCSATLCKTVKLGAPAPCVSNFSYKDPQVNNTSTVINLSKVEITYIDANGEIYNSRLQPQQPGSFFKILSEMPYQRNEKGESTRRIGVSFTCRVYSTTTSKFIDLVITESNMAVAHP